MNNISNFKNLFSTQTEEFAKTTLPFRGQLPEWLEGSLLRTGPSLFTIGNTRLNHLFDGMAKFYKISFSGSTQSVSFTSRFAQSDAFLKARKTDALESHEFGSNPKRSRLQTILEAFDFKATDNPNVNIFFLNQRYFACTETPFLTEFEPSSLATIGHLNLSESFKSQVSTAHPHFDFRTGQLFNFLIEYGPVSTYKLFSWKQGENTPKHVASVKTKKPAYLHSFAMTENHIVLILGPLIVNPLELLFSGKPFIENFKWNAAESTRIYVINKHNKSINSFELEPFFVFHHINAYETDKRIEVDLLSYKDASIIQQLYLDDLCSGLEMNKPAVPCIKRISIDLANKQIEKTLLNENGLELPTIDYKNCSTQKYDYFYGVAEHKKGDFLNKLVKISAKSALAEASWHEENCYPSEAIFVPGPVSNSGILISIVTNIAQSISFCLILDSNNLGELCRIPLPHLIPFHFHGQFREGLL